MSHRWYLGACFVKEPHKDGHLKHKGDSSDEQDAQAIDNAFSDYRTQSFAEINSIRLVQYSTTGELAHTGDDEVGGIRDEDGIDAIDTLGMLT